MKKSIITIKTYNSNFIVFIENKHINIDRLPVDGDYENENEEIIVSREYYKNEITSFANDIGVDKIINIEEILDIIMMRDKFKIIDYYNSKKKEK